MQRELLELSLEEMCCAFTIFINLPFFLQHELCEHETAIEIKMIPFDLNLPVYLYLLPTIQFLKALVNQRSLIWVKLHVPMAWVYSIFSFKIYLSIWNETIASTCCVSLPSVLCRVLTDQKELLLYTVFLANSYFQTYHLKKKKSTLLLISVWRQDGMVSLT